MIIGELINSSRKSIRPLIEAKDEQGIIAVARAQQEAGADYLDVNCGTFLNDEPERLSWLVSTISDAIDLPLCLDSPNAAAIRTAMPLVRSRAIINSISDEKERFENILPIVKEFDTKIIALTMSDGQIPQTVEDRFTIAERLIGKLVAAGVKEDDIYLDPLVQPLAVSEMGASVITSTVANIKFAYPKLHTVCGLSNISFGLPGRKLINRYFLTQIIGHGMDSFILDPTDNQLMGAYFAAMALAGKDKYCKNYLKAHKKGLYGQ